MYALVFSIFISGSCISASETNTDSEVSLKDLTSEEITLRAYDDELESQFELGFRYEKGLGVPRSPKNSAYWYRTAAKRGHREAQYRLGVYYLKAGIFFRKDGETEKSKLAFKYAVDWFRTVADRGHGEAKARIGDMYYFGWGVETNEAKAAEWFHQSAEQNNSMGLQRLARAFKEGKGVDKDEQKAAKLFLKSAELGYKIAMHDIGILYYHGLGVDKDVVKSLEWLSKGCKSGFEKSCPTMVSVMEKEDVGGNEIKKVIDTITDAKEKGIPSGIFALGYMYSRGVGFEKDLDAGMTLYMKAAEKEFPNAFDRFVFLYLSGHHPKKYTLRIRDLLKSRATSGNKKAYCGLGVFYTQGRYTPVDKELGYVWLNKCIDSGIVRYQDYLDRLIGRMSTKQLEKAKELALLY